MLLEGHAHKESTLVKGDHELYDVLEALVERKLSEDENDLVQFVWVFRGARGVRVRVRVRYVDVRLNSSTSRPTGILWYLVWGT